MGAVREDETVTAFSFPPAPQPTVLEAEFQQLVDLGLARPVTLAPPMDCLPFWGTQQDLLACLGQLPLPGPVWGAESVVHGPENRGKSLLHGHLSSQQLTNPPSFSTNPPPVAPWFFKGIPKVSKEPFPLLDRGCPGRI